MPTVGGVASISLDSLLANIIPRGFDNRVKLLFVVGFANEFGRSLVSVYLPLYLYSDFGATYQVVGLALTVTTGSSAFFQIVGGLMADSWGRKRSMVISSCVRIPILLMLTIGSGAKISILPFVGLYSIGEALNGIFLTASYAMIADVVKVGRRAEAYGIYRVGTNLGFTLGALIGGFIPALPTLFEIWLFCISLSSGLVVFAVSESQTRITSKIHLKAIFSVGKDRTLLEFALVALLAGLVANQMGTTFALYTANHLKITREQLGSLYSLNGVLIILLQYPVSRFVFRYRLSRLLSVASGLRAVGFLLVAVSHDFRLLQIVIVTLTLGEMLQAPSGASYAAAIASDTKRGEYLGFYNWAWNSGQALSPLMGGLLLALLAPSDYGTWVVIFAIGVICSVFYVILGNRAQASLSNVADIL